MDWILPAVLLVPAYALPAYYIHTQKLWEDHITFYGPIMAIKTDRVGFFDCVCPLSHLPPDLRDHRRCHGGGRLGADDRDARSLRPAYRGQRPPLTAANEPQNVLAIPGVNDFIPLTFAADPGAYHHDGGPRVRARDPLPGRRYPGEIDGTPASRSSPSAPLWSPMKRTRRSQRACPKMRMFGAGITNNILAGADLFWPAGLPAGFCRAARHPLRQRRLCGLPCLCRRVPPNSVIKEVNGVSVASRDDVARMLNSTRPGDPVRLLVGKQRTTEALYPDRYVVACGELGPRQSGFMGVSYYDTPLVKTQFDLLHEPVGPVILLAVPIYTITDPGQWSQFSLLTIDTTDAVMWQVPFPQFWFVIQAPLLVRVVQPSWSGPSTPSR